MLRDTLDAFVRRDAALARDVLARDEGVDQMYNALFREVLTFMMEDPRTITPSMHLHFIAKNLERMGDLVTNMAEQVIYLVTGEKPQDERPKGDTHRLHGRAVTGAAVTPAASAHVLLVEDEPAQREMLAYNLEAEGFRVTQAASGDEGLSALRGRPARRGGARLDAARASRGSRSAAACAPGPRRGGFPSSCSRPAPRRWTACGAWRSGPTTTSSSPTRWRELLARVRAQLRRVRPAAMGQVLEFEDIALDAETHRVTRGGPAAASSAPPSSAC